MIIVTLYVCGTSESCCCFTGTCQLALRLSSVNRDGGNGWIIAYVDKISVAH